MATSRFVPAHFGIFQHRQAGRPTKDSAEGIESECDLPPGASELVSDVGVIIIE